MYRIVTCAAPTSASLEADRAPQAELVLLTASSADGPAEPLLAADAEPGLADAVARSLRRPECRGTPGELTLGELDHGRRLLLVGLGPRETLDLARVRLAAGALLAPAHRMGLASVRVHGDLTTLHDADNVAHAFGEGLGLGAFRFDQFKARPASDSGPERLVLHCDDEAFAADLRAGLDLAGSANLARRLAATPPNIATPANLADEARQLARDAGLTCNVYAGDDLQAREMIGLINVGKASEHKPCLIELIYEPTPPPPSDSPRGRPTTFALVGKTITFDSGGLSLKINDTMRHMKYDKAAGCAVLGAMHAIARLQPGCRVVGLLPAAENAISHEAYRVDDILRFPNGVSVDVTNTDFEGRLVLADALIHACQHHQPDVLIDLGTLTGEIIQALGHRTAGLWCDDTALRQRLLDAGERAGEPVWPMPLNEEHHRSIEAVHADVVNIALDKPGKPCQCAAFLRRFVSPGVRWAHLDIAGPVHVEQPDPPFDIGPTGYGTRLLHALFANHGDTH